VHAMEHGVTAVRRGHSTRTALTTVIWTFF